ncbi:hypothetical protein KP509_03G035300 [Ceratopteris richardii]|uniref:Uncharacterized protein n=1 Tax=Ceratopteris richardii TaxID=49495 RepID=A0A8T2UYX1_CERRI|nr:hypothetical protein KP509_03G035300 [Ceratopteris richardii]
MNEWDNLNLTLYSPLVNWKSPNCCGSLSIQRQVSYNLLEDSPGLFGEDYGADALSLMQQLSQQTATAYMEAEKLLSSESRKEGQVSVTGGSIGKENNVMSFDKQIGDGLCSPGSLLVDMSSWSLPSVPTPGHGESSHLIYAKSSDLPSPSLYLLRECR